MAGSVIVPDYTRPSALMVPHYDATLIELLEGLAVAASQWIGVILLSGNPALSQAFVARQERPQRFSIVAAPYDTPWIRDRAPIAVRGADGVGWILPRMIEADRPLDDRLFETISAKTLRPAPLAIAQGNLVAGPAGIALSTTRVLRENGVGEGALAALGPDLGIRHWIVFEPFPDEPTGHSDVHVRFLNAQLMAVAWHRDDPILQQRAMAIEDRVRAVSSRMRSLRIPLVREGKRYASLVNWIQIGRNLLLPTYDLTAPDDLAEATRLLADEGFRVYPLASPTLDLGGSLHCLTASVFV
jgi:agmatine/peptidylarginine deiminase